MSVDRPQPTPPDPADDAPRSGPDAERTSLEHRRDQIDRLQETIGEALTRHGYADSSRFAVRLALEEAISNAFNHGHASLPDERPIRVAWGVTGEHIEIEVEDQGPGFNPGAVPDPTLEENLEKPAGRGVLLIRAFMSEVSFEGRGNLLRMRYRKDQGPPKLDDD